MATSDWKSGGGNYPSASIRQLPPLPLWAAAAMAAVAAWFLTTHFLHIFSEAINWDEFALLERSERTLRFGKVVGGGRPGLVTLMLIPFVKGCVDATRSIVEARIFWQCITLAYLLGVYFLVRRWFVHVGRTQEGIAQGLLAVALLAFLPAFVTWSVQVRTDQAALAATTWGGVLLLSNRRRRAAMAGVLFAAGVLCTQKAVYSIALMVMLYVTATAARIQTMETGHRTEFILVLKRLFTVAFAGIVVVAVYLMLAPDATRLASGDSVATSLETMRYQRSSQGYRIYTVHAARLVVHWVLFAALILWTLRVLRTRDAEEMPLLATCWLSLLLGLAVIVFHGSSFPYFIMTAGLFPAIGLAMPLGRPLAMSGRWAWVLVVLLIGLAAVQSARESVQMLYDTQLEQRETLRLVSDSLLSGRRGYQVEGALLCTHDPEPMPAMFSQGIWQRFHESPQAAQNSAQFIAEFRMRPIAYIVESYRLGQFPEEIRAFWSQHYVWYARSLYVAGYNIADPREIEIIVAGKYRWDPARKSPSVALKIGSTVMQPGDAIEFGVGTIVVEPLGEHAQGQLILADLPRPIRDGYPAFYHRRQIYQLGGRL